MLHPARSRELDPRTAAAVLDTGELMVCRHDGANPIIIRNAAIDTLIHPRLKSRLKHFHQETIT